MSVLEGGHYDCKNEFLPLPLSNKSPEVSPTQSWQPCNAWMQMIPRTVGCWLAPNWRCWLPVCNLLWHQNPQTTGWHHPLQQLGLRDGRKGAVTPCREAQRKKEADAGGLVIQPGSPNLAYGRLFSACGTTMVYCDVWMLPCSPGFGSLGLFALTVLSSLWVESFTLVQEAEGSLSNSSQLIQNSYFGKGEMRRV